ncbi:MAG: MCE family protein [Nocardioidaceae bacterium]|nr:MCE family protein [Nocardioidaceae bacterium]MCL2611774.1 MCE family protein [Nocardioidaceae bacterium]
MSRGVRIRLMAFVALSAVGLIYVTASYLGVVDKITGKDMTVTATLPDSGGLYVGSEADYRGVRIGKVTQVVPTTHGIDVSVEMKKSVQLPTSSQIYVHNLSAVGEQYIDFDPPNGRGPYAVNGTVFHGSKSSLPEDEGDLLVTLNKFVTSVNKNALRGTIKELGAMFRGTGPALQRMIDSGTVFINQASRHTKETVQLLDNGLKVLRTQSGEKENIRSFAGDLDKLTTALRDSDPNLRKLIHNTPPAARELQALLEDLGPTMPTLLGNLISLDQVVDPNLPGIEQLLVTYPALIAAGPTGSTADGWGHVNIQFDYSVPPCTDGYLPPSQWRSTQVTTDEDKAYGGIGHYPATCKSPLPYERRGTNQALLYTDPNRSSPARDYSGGARAGDSKGRSVRYQEPPNLSVLGGDSWKWLLVGPVTQQ